MRTAASQFLADNTEKAIEQMGATQEYVEQMLTWQTISGRVSEAIRQQAQPTATEEDARMRTFTYVFFNTASITDDNGETRAMTDEEKEEQAGTGPAADRSHKLQSGGIFRRRDHGHLLLPSGG